MHELLVFNFTLQQNATEILKHISNENNVNDLIAPKIRYEVAINKYIFNSAPSDLDKFLLTWPNFTFS